MLTSHIKHKPPIQLERVLKTSHYYVNFHWQMNFSNLCYFIPHVAIFPSYAKKPVLFVYKHIWKPSIKADLQLQWYFQHDVIKQSTTLRSQLRTTWKWSLRMHRTQRLHLTSHLFGKQKCFYPSKLIIFNKFTMTYIHVENCMLGINNIVYNKMLS